MMQPNPSPSASEEFSGRWHRVGALELRRLVLEGATILEEGTPPLPASDAELQLRLPDQETLLVCFDADGTPSTRLAARLSSCGYKHVFTAETSWAGLVARDAAAGPDRP